ncbi:putative E3 ubiquitin-protein ligase UBR7 [Drosophila grimshawi]|uniref:GH11702 n=1 Tax=Drosophila grimshawi TaxID=7222 RepID=B4JD17_DROGR|nr:putative E3 ubiquitin-protein ligase UBR7 [Drosophila grimshawi]EDW04261.1 GH11702 [Drosophila grimshawi]
MGDSNETNPQDQSTITMLDVLEEEAEMEEEYAAVLGGSDEKECTYAKGAIDRQALYSCLTCCPAARTDPTKSAAICLACSYRCHENHELIELYTKRNFRCDCPTLRLGADKRCALNPQLDALQAPNAENLYNHNFQGLYCKCKRPYPDPERIGEELMLQCVICEDWFHLQHMQSPPVSKKWLEACSEMICDNCMERNQFLSDYIGLAVQPAEQEGKRETDIEVSMGNEQEVKGTKEKKSELESDSKQKESELEPELKGTKNEQLPAEAKSELESEPKGTKSHLDSESKSKLESALNGTKSEQSQAEAKQKKRESESKAESGERAEKRAKLSEEICRRPKRNTEYKGAAFWANDWRTALCQCSACIQLYRDQSVEFLLDANDSVKAYEERGKKRAEDNSTYQQAIRALASIDRTKQIDVITEYNRMGDRLKEFLQAFASSNRVVTEDDIKGFFAGMRSENHANRGQPYFCR